MRVLAFGLLVVRLLVDQQLTAQVSECGNFSSKSKGAVDRTLEGGFATYSLPSEASASILIDLRTRSSTSDTVFIVSLHQDKGAISQGASYRIADMSDRSGSDFTGAYLESSRLISTAASIRSWESRSGTLKIISQTARDLQGEFRFESMGWGPTSGQKLKVEGTFRAVLNSERCKQLARAAKVLPPPPEPKEYSFAGTKWGEDSATVAEKLDLIGFRFELATDPEEHVYRGSLIGNPAIAYVGFVDGGVADVTVAIESKEGRSKTLYDELKKTLIDKYGEPKEDLEDYTWPFKSGDKYEDLAITSGKATIGASWEDSGSQLRLVLTETHWVAVRYASAKGVARAVKRKAKSLQPF